MTRHVSTLTLHKYRYGELSDAEASQVRAHADQCDQCGVKLRDQQNQRAAFELMPVPPAIREASEKQRTPARSPLWSWFAVGMAMAALLLAVLALPVGTTPDDGIRTKGGTADFEVWLDTPEGPRSLREIGVAQSGDRIQVRFRRPRAPWVSLAGEDGTGSIEVYHSWRTDMDSAEWQVAPFALELDDAPGDQALYLVYSEDRPAPRAVREAIEHDSPAVEHVVIEKGQ